MKQAVALMTPMSPASTSQGGRGLRAIGRGYAGVVRTSMGRRDESAPVPRPLASRGRCRPLTVCQWVLWRREPRGANIDCQSMSIDLEAESIALAFGAAVRSLRL